MNLPPKVWWQIPTVCWEHSPVAARRLRNCRYEGVQLMLGKLAGAWLGDKIAGKNEGAKGAILGDGAAALARRSVPTLAALALGGWAFRKWRSRRSGASNYSSSGASV